MVGVSAEHRKDAKVQGGDEIEVTIELDTDPRHVEIPKEFETFLLTVSGNGISSPTNFF